MGQISCYLASFCPKFLLDILTGLQLPAKLCELTHLLQFWVYRQTLELGDPGILVKTPPQLIINSTFFCDAGQSVFNNILLEPPFSSISSVKLQSSRVLRLS